MNAGDEVGLEGIKRGLGGCDVGAAAHLCPEDTIQVGGRDRVGSMKHSSSQYT